jgi:hypothetical protein
VPDFGLTEALSKALAAAKEVPVMRPAEQALAARAAKAAPAEAAPAVPAAAAPSVQAPPAVAPPGAAQAPPIDPSRPPADIPAPQPSDAAAAPTAAPVGPDLAPSTGDAAPPTGAVAASQPDPIESATPFAEQVGERSEDLVVPPGVAPANKLPAQSFAEQVGERSEDLVVPAEEQAKRFVTANIGDFGDKLNMSHMPNVETMSSPDGVKAAILQVADDNKGAIDAARRGTVTDEQLTGLAQDLSLNSDIVKQVLTREFGMDLQRPEVMLAARMVEQQQVGSLFALAGKVADGSAASEEIAQFEQQMQTFAQYRAQLSGAQAEWGRGGRALQIPVGLDPAVLDHVASVIKQNNPDMQATAQAIRLAGTPGGIASINQGSLWYRSLVKAPFNLLQRVFINGILAGPPTWEKIFLGNNLNLGLNTFDIFSAGIGRGMAGLAARAGAWPTAQEGATISDAYAHFHGVITGGADALRVAGRVLKSGQSMDNVLRSQEDFGRGTLASGPGAIIPELGDSYFGGIARLADSAIDLPGRIIGSIDDFTKTLGFRGYVTMMNLKDIRARIQMGTLRAGDAEAEMTRLMQNPSPELQQAAEAWAHRMTFQSPFPEGGVGEAFTNVLNKAPALRFIFPFMRTATNIFKQSVVERTPLAAFSARIRAQIAAGGFEGDLAKARIATGTAIGSMVAWMAIHDRITGDAPKDPKARQEWEMDGRTPYSVRITDPITGKDTWRNYQWLEPIATIAGVTADAVQVQSYIHATDDAYSMMPQDDRLQDAIAHIMASVIQNTGNKTFMQGASQFAEMYNDPQRAFAMWGDQMGAAAVPYSGALRFARNEQDPFLRQAFSLIDKIKDELPTSGSLKGSKTLEPRLDFFGEPRKTFSGNSILGPMNPLPGSPSTKDPLTDEIQSVMEQTRTVPITMPSKQLALLGNGKGMQDGQGMRLTPSEYYDYVTMSRKDPIFDNGTKTFRDKLNEMIASPVYQGLTPPDRAVHIENIQNQADKIGRERLFKENPDFAERLVAWTAQANRQKFNK